MSGWDLHLAEYGDTLERSCVTAKRACTVCGKPTRAISGICPSHELTLFDTDGDPANGSSQIGVDDPWPPEMF